jgi:hypothetical protein
MSKLVTTAHLPQDLVLSLVLVGLTKRVQLALAALWAVLAIWQVAVHNKAAEALAAILVMVVVASATPMVSQVLAVALEAVVVATALLPLAVAG